MNGQSIVVTCHELVQMLEVGVHCVQCSVQVPLVHVEVVAGEEVARLAGFSTVQIDVLFAAWILAKVDYLLVVGCVSGLYDLGFFNSC